MNPNVKILVHHSDMIFFIESNKERQDHSEINAAMIKVIKYAYKDTVTLFSTIGQFNAITKIAEIDDLIFKQIKVIDRGSSSWLFKEILEIWSLLKVLRKASKNPVRFVYVSSVFSTAHYFIKVIKKFYPKVRLVIGLHGEVEFIRPGKSKKLRFLGYFIKRGFALKSDENTKYLAFGEVVKANILSLGYLDQSDIISIDHPYNYSTELRQSQNPTKITLGTVGIASQNKKTHLIFELASRFETEIENGKFGFKIVGSLLPNIRPYINKFVHISGKRDLLTDIEYKTEIAELTYILFFYDNDFYKLCPSGAFFDSLKYEKPILAIENDFFNYYFKKLGNIGHLFKNLEEMERFIRNEIKLNSSYDTQVENLRKGKADLSLENIANNLLTELTF